MEYQYTGICFVFALLIFPLITSGPFFWEELYGIGMIMVYVVLVPHISSMKVRSTF
jgi:hypothetical protein